MNQGVIYFNMGNKCCTRMLVSMYSLKKHYNGSITLLASGEQDERFIAHVKELGINVKYFTAPSNLSALTIKSTLYHYTPYDVTMFIDADTVIVGNIDEFFERVKEHEFATYWFSKWTTNTRSMYRRVMNMSKVCPTYVQATLNYSYAINTGIFGFVKNASILPEWEALSIKTFKMGVNSVITDEIACQMLLHKYPHWLAGNEWGVSVKHGVEELPAKIYHYHGRKHAEDYPRCSVWKKEFWELYHLKKWDMLIDLADRRLLRYINKLPEITIVTAVDDRYLPKLKENYSKWINTDGIMQHSMICYYSNIDVSELDFMQNNVRKIKWDMPNASSQREKMLSAFVFGAARDVQTKYWCKLDADTYPVVYNGYGYIFNIPSTWYDYLAAGNRCNYTKGVGFLKRLEEWGDNVNVMNEYKRLYTHLGDEILDTHLRVSNKRIASYFALYHTNLTKWIANNCKGRLPVPSEDSTVSYVLQRMQKPFLRVMMKNYFNHS